FKAWDKTLVAPGAVGAAGANSVSKETKVLTVSVANHPPALDTTPNVTLPSVSSSSAKLSGGVTVGTLLGKAFSDPDGIKSLKGIAITVADNSNGKWQYSLGAGVWLDIGAVTDTSALLLSDKAKVRFVPTSGNTGGGTIQYKAWDRTAGQSGDRGVD